MRFLRALLLLLLSVALPLHAGARAWDEMPCPMQASAAAEAQAAHALDIDGTGGEVAHCCVDGEGADGGAQACKAGVDCKAGGATLPTAAPAGSAAGHDAPLRTRASPSRITSAPADIWRPPSLPGL